MTLALIGANALYIMYAWLACCIACTYLSGRKGYGEKVGLATGLFLTIIGVVIWLVWPPKPTSDWKVVGPFGKGTQRRRIEARDHAAGEAPGPTQGTGARAG